MMRNVFSRLRMVAFGLGVLAAGSVVEASTLSLKAVKKSKCVGGANNGLRCGSDIGTNSLNDCPGGLCQLLPITPGTCNLGTSKCTTGPVGNTCANNNDCPIGTNDLPVLGYDTIQVEFFVRGWAAELPDGIRTFEMKLNGLGFQSPDNGVALPQGWHAPVARISCTSSATCPAAYPICDLNHPITHINYGCVAAGHEPDLGAFITTSRTDWLLFGLDLPINPAIATSTLYYRYNALADHDDVLDTPGTSRYLGTLIVKVSANACGTFTIGFVEELTATFIADFNGNPVLPVSEPLHLTVSDCSRQLLSCSPDHCFEDARIAHGRLNVGQKLNNDTFLMTFSKSTAGMTSADFEVTRVPVVAGDPAPGIAVNGVTPNGNNVTVQLSQKVLQARWTCIRDKGSNKRCCQGTLPVDAFSPLGGDGNPIRISEQADVFKIRDNLKEPREVIPALAIERCDSDRSTICTAADVLIAVDELKGYDTFALDTPPSPGVDLDSLEVCPTMKPPP